MPLCYQGVKDKGARIEAVRRGLELTREEIAAIGDDEPDIPMFEAAALSACPADADPAAQKAATMVLESPRRTRRGSRVHRADPGPQRAVRGS